MRKILLLAMCALVSGLAFGQHSYYKYQADDSITTVVPVSSINTGTTYLVSINREKNEIAVTTLTGNCPQSISSSTLTNWQLFAGGNYGSYVLNGGFVDDDENIVVYGAHCRTSSRQGAIIKLNMSGGNVTSVKHELVSEEIMDGCAVVYGSTIYYYFATSSSVFRTSNTLATSAQAVHRKKISNALNISLEYDPIMGKLVISGCLSDTSVFIASSGLASLMNMTMYRFKPTTNSYIESYTNALSIGGNGYYSDSIAYVIQPLETTLGSAYWLLKVNYVTGSVYSSKMYSLNNNRKLSVKDAANNFDNLFIVGMDMAVGRIVGYIDMNNLNSYSFMTAQSFGLSSSYLSGLWNYEDLVLTNISYDHYTGNVVAGGAITGYGVLMDAYYISNCGNTVTVSVNNENYTTANSVSLQTYTVSVPASTTQTSYRNILYSFDESCVVCDYGDAVFQKKSDIEHNEDYENIDDRISLNVHENRFVCSGFKGNCEYVVYDMLGKIVCSGAIHNGEECQLSITSNGLYIIKVSDDNNNSLSEKIVIAQ